MMKRRDQKASRGDKPELNDLGRRDAGYWLRIIRICSALALARSLLERCLRRISLRWEPVGRCAVECEDELAAPAAGGAFV
jgi:hypothetical protein